MLIAYLILQFFGGMSKRKLGNENIMRLHNQLFTLKMAGFVQSAPKKGGSDMRTEEGIKKALKELRENKNVDHHLLSARILPGTVISKP